jgi:hypothetical protein
MRRSISRQRPSTPDVLHIPNPEQYRRVGNAQKPREGGGVA